MPPIITIVIANYNHKHLLPRLLDSILAQDVHSMEVIVVDDASDEHCMDIIIEYLDKGLNIRCIEHTTRQYTKNARLTGIKEARGGIIAFADADDILWGTQELAKNIEVMLHEQADVVHFPIAMLGEDHSFRGEWIWAHPYNDRLLAPDIFSTYVHADMRAHVVYNKLYSRDLWLKILEGAQASGVRHWREDLLLVSHYLLHATRYAGTEHMAYGHHWCNNASREKAETVEAMGLMLREFLPYARTKGVPDELIERMKTSFLARLYSNLRTMATDALPESPDEDLAALLAASTKNVSLDSLAKTMLVAYQQALHFFDRQKYLRLQHEETIRLLKEENLLLRHELEKITLSESHISVCPSAKAEGSRSAKTEKQGTFEEPGPWPIDGNDLLPLKNLYANRRCFIIGNGPSLNLHDLSLLQDDITIACNGIFYKTEETGFIPTFYTVEDPEFVKANVAAINAYTVATRVIPTKYWDSISNRSNSYWFRLNLGFYSQSSPLYHQPHFSTCFAERSYSGHTISYTNMQLAYWLGCREVYLIGMDHRYVIPSGAHITGNQICSEQDDPNHFHPEYFKNKIWHDPQLYHVERNFKLARETFEAAGRKIHNASIGGDLTIFERTDYNSLF